MVTLYNTDYEVDKDRDVLIYVAQQDKHATITEVIRNMSSIAQRENKAVEVNFNGVVFQITPTMQPIEGINSYLTAVEQTHQKTPQNSLQKKLAESQEQASVDTQIKNEELDVTGFKSVYQDLLREEANHPTRDFMDRWGKLMQAEMKKMKSPHLTLDMVNQTSKRARYGMNLTQAQIDSAYSWLTIIWKHGPELARVSQYDLLDNALIRALTNDKTKQVYEDYQQAKATNETDMAQDTGHLLAYLIPDPRLIDRFTERASACEHWQKLIPILNLPKNANRKTILSKAGVFAKKELGKKSSPYALQQDNLSL